MDTRVSLLLRIKDPQDEQAWSEFDGIYRPMLHRFAKSQGLSDADAEDEVQRCMSAIQQIMSDFKYDPQKGRFKSWLRTMINNRCRNHRRDRQAHQARIQAAQEHKDQQKDQLQESPEDVFDRIWMEEHLKHALRSMRDEVEDIKYKAFEQYVVNERPVKEVCDGLGITPAQLYKIKWQLTQKLREHISALLKGRGGCVTMTELQRYHARDMPGDEITRIEAHLAACHECCEKNARLLNNHERVCDMLRSIDLGS